MTIEEILKALAHEDRKFPREALEQAVAQKDGTTGIFMGTNQVAPDETGLHGGSQNNF